MLLVLSPSSDGGVVERLSNLVDAGGVCGAFRFVEAEAGVVPFEADGGDDGSGVWLGLFDEAFVSDVDDGDVEGSGPVGHQSAVGAVEACEVAEVVSEGE